MAEISVEEVIAACEAANRRVRMLLIVQACLVVLSGLAVITAVAIKFMGGHSGLVIQFGLGGMLCGLGALIPGRMAKPIYSKLERFQQIAEQEAARRNVQRVAPKAVEQSGGAEPPKIPLTIGFANLSGDDLGAIASEDAKVLSPLFAQSRVVAPHQIPGAEILFVYAHLKEDGTIEGPTLSGIRQVVQLANAAIVILASPNSSSCIQNAATLPGPKTANIVFTLDRNGSGFCRFFYELFEKMRDGKDMLTAWVELAPQHPEASTSYAPQTVLLAEGGKIAFPH